ncbi:MAG: universal stress protein, partial [Anaerolineales bacterium]|nr:universal stress protein [Anaerolineales bacterium]
DIPLDAIIGSVGRYGDFTRSFLPRSDSMKQRWAAVKTLATSGEGWPPIQVYQLGSAYFVLDGNHRVSVARQLGMRTIQAYVTEVVSRLPLTPDVQPDDLICKEQHAAFLERTGLDTLRREADLSVTAPGAYRILQEHIEVHRHYLGLEWQREFPLPEAAASWYDHVYRPVVAVIRERGLLCDFPERTETDLYIWLSRYRAQLAEALSWDITLEEAAADLAEQAPKRPSSGVRQVADAGKKLVEAILPEELQAGPPPGEWRRQRLIDRYVTHLFRDVLVPVSGQAAGWHALAQALVIARREGSRLRGLHVVPEAADAERPEVRAVEAEFGQRCAAAGVNGRLVVEAGAVAQTVVHRARWNDLVVMTLRYPPGDSPRARLDSGFRRVVQQCPRPILAVPQTVSPLTHALLAYDGRAKAEEALFMAAYLAETWRIPLTVVMAADRRPVETAVVDRARDYLALHEIEAAFVIEKAEAAGLVLETAVGRGCDLIVMGGYGTQPLVEVVLGSTANEVLRQTRVPVLICQ